jgi:hypothetical protein
VFRSVWEMRKKASEEPEASNDNKEQTLKDRFRIGWAVFHQKNNVKRNVNAQEILQEVWDKWQKMNYIQNPQALLVSYFLGVSLWNWAVSLNSAAEKPQRQKKLQATEALLSKVYEIRHAIDDVNTERTLATLNKVKALQKKTSQVEEGA